MLYRVYVYGIEVSIRDPEENTSILPFWMTVLRNKVDDVDWENVNGKVTVN